MSEVKSVDIKSLIDSYEFPCKLPGSGQELLIRPLTTGQMKKILVYEGETNPYVVEQALDRLITECVVSDGFDITDLYLQDRFFLLIEIRKVSKGSSYEFKFNCPKCNFENVKQFSLNDLVNIPKKEIDSLIRISEKMKFRVDFPTRRDQINAIKKYKNVKMTEAEREIEIVTATFANCIKEIHTADGIIKDASIDDKIFVLDNIKTDVYDEFKQWFKDSSFGIEFKVSVGCGSCDFVENMDIPLSNFFA